MSRIAIQNSGMLTPTWLTTVATWSAQEPDRIADTTPSGTAMHSATSSPHSASDSVAGSRSTSASDTGWPVRKLTPRSPVSAPPT